MSNARKLARAVALSMIITAGMVTFSPTLHASSDRSVQVRCQLLQRAIDAAIALSGADSELVIYLQGQYAAVCTQ